MKKSVLISLLVGIMGIIVFVGCTKDNRYVYTPNDELYEYCAFDSLSYWIYEDSVILQIDSIIVRTSPQKSTDTVRVSPETTVFALTFTQTYELTDLRTMHSQCFVVKPTVSRSLSCLTSSINKTDDYYTSANIETQQINPYFTYINNKTPSEDAINHGYNDGLYKYSEFLDSIVIYGNTYYDVKKIETTAYNYSDTNTYYCIYYWAKNIGMIRREFFLSDSIVQVKNLIRYNVINVQNQYK